MTAQINFFDELIVDNFAGGGGASTGIELATGRVVDIAINHDPAAILMHQTNHPHTEHYQDSVWNVDPVKLCRGRPVGLAWFSPDCKHFSKAKGKALVDRGIRGLAWIVCKWAALVRPRVIILENVEEFVTWGPVRKGKPVKKKEGHTFNKWLSQIKALGYDVEYKELVAADYGTPTSRKRFFLIARCDGKPIVWPKPTHAPATDKRVQSGELKPYKTAADVIDWSLPCPSIFDTKQEILEKYGLKAVRPLADNTMRRVARGLDKFVIKSAKPFIVECNHSGNGHIHDIETPLNTVTAKCSAGVCNPTMAPFVATNTTGSIGSSVDSPVNTITTGGNQLLITPIMAHHKFSNAPQDIKNPLSTITAVGAHELIAPSLIQYHSEQSNKENRAYSINNPLMTADSSNRFGLSACFLSKYFTGVDGAELDNPLPTVTAIDHNSLCMAHIAEFKGKDKGQAADAPLRTVMPTEVLGAVKTFIVKATPGVNLYNWHKVRELLNKYCGYELKDDEIILFKIGRDFYFIADIGLRMLCPKELYAAMGFPEDYIIERDYLGNEYKRKYQVARCGNAVCPQIAKALVQANLPEYCVGINIKTMYELLKRVAI